MDPVVIGLGAFGVVMVALLILKTMAATEWEDAAKVWEARALKEQTEKNEWRQLAEAAQALVDQLKTPRAEGKYGRATGFVQAHEALSNTETLRKMGLIDQKKGAPTAPVVKHGGRGASPAVVVPVPDDDTFRVPDSDWTAPDVSSPTYSSSDNSPSYSDSSCGSSSYSDSSSSSSSSDCGSSSSSGD